MLVHRRDLRRQWKSFQESEPFLHVLQGFLHAIDWREPWIVSILAFHVLTLVIALVTRKRGAVQLFVFVLAGGVIFNAERLNKLGAQHWEKFAGQNYFDSTGVFMSAVVSGPQLLVMFIILINYLINCAGMLVEAKKRELIYKAKQRAKEAKASGASAGNKKED
ncbi:hypothetical protein VOLCADRAFT_64706 [Volvox carteri f. nagariensis]|uniref:Uncharacterized protein n=1 Tax=Volvox carteri f. nagariensis TaxID=3068 RepID=D8U6P7_VOLCA|nr:uncharacterized protein VOLCADRAFT_64706 [Volvox carteri f. nagariensis]EFJ44547.1 hypothetical protein VOLCADRAFT_64706 [Volvox carteri f. nagariensis]|eukprot:XP_002954397.1 hypothetical protein VOLCADRAFT_64706 [Volvox carteri f. nagariensis]